MTRQAAPKDDAEHKTIALEAWKKVVQTQEHFNEICMKVRTLYATVIAVVLSVYGAFLKGEVKPLHVAVMDVDPILPVSLAIILVTYLFYFVDRYWYHRLLLGSVAQGAFIENRWKAIIPEICMGKEITDKSAVDLAQRPLLFWLSRLVVTDERLKTTSKLHSDAKIEVFYKPIGWLAGAVLLLSFLFGGLRVNGSTIAHYAAQGFVQAAQLRSFG